MMNMAHKAIDRLATLPGLLQWRKRRFSRRFADGQAITSCLGVFETFEAAAAAAPASRPTGYNHPDAAAMYRDRLERLFPSDYAMMVWLQKAFNDGARKVFDLGGHIGLSYYAYQRALDFPDGVSWTVNDVPAINRVGQEEATLRDPSRRLAFTDHFDGAADADVLFTSGCLQYLDETLAQRIATLARRPRWLLVNLLPLHPRLSYWTVQSIGTAFCPYRIQQAERFFADLKALGYLPLDQWENLDKRCHVAFEPAHTLDRYHGAALKLG